MTVTPLRRDAARVVRYLLSACLVVAATTALHGQVVGADCVEDSDCAAHEGHVCVAQGEHSPGGLEYHVTNLRPFLEAI